MDRVVRAEGRLTGGSVPVRAPRDGRIARVRIAAGQEVKTGDPLIDLDGSEPATEVSRCEARLAGLAAQRERLGAEGRRLRESVHPREMDEAARQRDRARLELQHAEMQLQSIVKLDEAGLAGKLEVEQARLAQRLAALDLQQAEGALPLLDAQHGARLEEIASDLKKLEGDIEAERIAREEASRALAECTVTSPAEGRIVTGSLDQLPRSAVRRGDEMLRIGGGAVDRFDGTLADTGQAAVRPGQRVKIRLDAYPWLLHRTLPGRVTRVAGRRLDAGGFPVEIVPDPGQAPGPLAEGMRGTARIVVEEKVPLWRLLLEEVTGRRSP